MMCEFCAKHGEGEKWYLQARNYSDDLLSDLRRRKLVERYYVHPEKVENDLQLLQTLDRAPAFVRKVIRWRVTGKMKNEHFNQVVPIEDVERIFGFAGSIVRIACLCRHALLKSEHRYCYRVSLTPQGGEMVRIIGGIDPRYLEGPDVGGLESLSAEEALASFREHEKAGLCHTVTTFGAPFVGGICNCDRSDCGILQATIAHSTPVMFRAEYVAEVDPDLCNGCRACVRMCQFGAFEYSVANRKAAVDARLCYGCGVCRSVCGRGAISLSDRASVPMAAKLW